MHASTHSSATRTQRYTNNITCQTDTQPLYYKTLTQIHITCRSHAWMSLLPVIYSHAARHASINIHRFNHYLYIKRTLSCAHTITRTRRIYMYHARHKHTHSTSYRVIHRVCKLYHLPLSSTGNLTWNPLISTCTRHIRYTCRA